MRIRKILEIGDIIIVQELQKIGNGNTDYSAEARLHLQEL
jgi:hypothetical protein